MLARFCALFAACFAAVAFAPAADPPAVTREYKVESVDEITTKSGDKKEEQVRVNSTYRYSWKRDGKDKTLLFSEIGAKTTVGDKTTADLKMNRAGMSGTGADGKPFNKKLDELPERQQLKIRNLFDTPLCRIEVDANGQEVKRKVLTNPDLDTEVGPLISEAIRFHPPYSPDKDEWEAPMSVSGGPLGEFTGKSTLKKVAGGKGGQAVRLNAVLTIGMKKSETQTLKEGKYTVTGTLTYNTDQKEWIAGKLTIDIAMTLEIGDKVKETVAVKGKRTLTFEMLPEKK